MFEKIIIQIFSPIPALPVNGVDGMLQLTRCLWNLLVWSNMYLLWCHKHKPEKHQWRFSKFFIGLQINVTWVLHECKFHRIFIRCYSNWLHGISKVHSILTHLSSAPVTTYLPQGLRSTPHGYDLFKWPSYRRTHLQH